MSKFRYMRRGIFMYKYTLHFEIVRLGLAPCKECLVHKMAIVNAVAFNSFIDFEWSNNWFGWQFQSITLHYLPPPCCFLLATGTSELDKIHSFAHPSDPSNVNWDMSMKITSEKSIFIYFSVEFQCFKIFALVRSGCLGDLFTDHNVQLFYTFYLLDSLDSSLSKIWAWGQKWLFISRKQVVKAFFFALSAQFSYIFSSLLYCSMISAKLLWYFQGGYSLIQ